MDHQMPFLSFFSHVYLAKQATGEVVLCAKKLLVEIMVKFWELNCLRRMKDSARSNKRSTNMSFSIPIIFLIPNPLVYFFFPTVQHSCRLSLSLVAFNHSCIANYINIINYSGPNVFGPLFSSVPSVFNLQSLHWAPKSRMASALTSTVCNVLSLVVPWQFCQVANLFS